MIKNLSTCMITLFDHMKLMIIEHVLLAPKEPLLYVYGHHCVKFLDPPLCWRKENIQVKMHNESMTNNNL